MRALPCLLLCLSLLACDDGGGSTAPADGAPLDRTVADLGPSPDQALPDAAPADAGFGPPPATLGGDRPAALRVPSDYDAGQPWPLVVLLGGYDYLAADWDAWLGASAYVDELGFVLLLPDGLVDAAGSPYWSATDTCCDFDGRGVDDVAYLRGLLAQAKAAVHVDPSRVVLVGHSNGGFMAYRMACDAADQVTAVVSLAGSGWLDGARCQPARPVSVLQAHGTLDEVMPYGGDDDAPGAEVMLARWAERSGCAPGEATALPQPLELVDDATDGETTVWVHEGCQAGTDVRLWRMDGSDHYPELRWAFTEGVLAWALGHPRP